MQCKHVIFFSHLTESQQTQEQTAQQA